MYSIGIKIPTWNEGHLQLFDDFMRKCVKAAIVTHEKIGLNYILWIWMLAIVLMNYKTHTIVMEVVLQQLDQYKNNGVMVCFSSTSMFSNLIVGSWICGFMLEIWNVEDFMVF